MAEASRWEDPSNCNWISHQALQFASRLSSLGASPDTAPSYFLRDDVRPFNQNLRTGEVKHYGIDAQLLAWHDCFTNPNQPFLLCIASGEDGRRAEAAAMRIADRRIAAGHPEIKWHQVIGGNRSYLLTPHNTDEIVDMLVIVGFSDKSTRVKQETVHDLLRKYQSKPRILTTTGENPARIMSNLRLKPTHMLNLDRNGALLEYEKQ